jgi:5-formaminoimidazole-4-carboxamide-1-beta-D-ribofuranosyl 5'-monophosphate synthetase
MLKILFIIFAVGIIYWLITAGAKAKNFHLPSQIYISSLGKNLFLSTHSYQRAKERGITVEELKEMLESKDSQANLQENGRIKVTNGILTAILGMDGDDLVLVTVFKNSQDPQSGRQPR